LKEKPTDRAQRDKYYCHSYRNWIRNYEWERKLKQRDWEFRI